MRKAITYVVGIACVGMAVMALAKAREHSVPVPPTNPDFQYQYRLGPDSQPQEGYLTGVQEAALRAQGLTLCRPAP